MFSKDEIAYKQMQNSNLVMLKLFPNIIIALEQICVFKTSAIAESAVCGTVAR